MAEVPDQHHLHRLSHHRRESVLEENVRQICYHEHGVEVSENNIWSNQSKITLHAQTVILFLTQILVCGETIN